VSVESFRRHLDAEARRRPRPEPEPDVSTLSPADAAFQRVKQHGHRTLALRAAAKMEARALEAGGQAIPGTRQETRPGTKQEAQPGTQAALAAGAKPNPPVKKTKPEPPPPKSAKAQWLEENCWWRPRGAPDGYRPDGTIHAYKPVDDDR
jgi:hypothetical protein